MRTLQAAVEQDRVAHAYLFAGPRGTGKTSLAKILRRRSTASTGRRRPVTVPASAAGDPRGRSLDLIELDAASNRGIDDDPRACAKGRLAPIEGRRKIYILDEAHALTRRRLERAPEDARGATGARHLRPLHDRRRQAARRRSVSRCQRFDFRRPGPGELADRAAAHRRRRADRGGRRRAAPDGPRCGGSFRDAVGTLDQLATVTHGAASAPTRPRACSGWCPSRRSPTSSI